MNGMALITAKTFTSANSKADKNGLLPVLLRCTAGTMPNKSILSGSVALSEGFEAGRSYICQYTETEESEDYGREFSFVNCGVVTGLELVELAIKLGPAVIVDVLDEDDDDDFAAANDAEEVSVEKAAKVTRKKRATTETGDLGD